MLNRKKNHRSSLWRALNYDSLTYFTLQSQEILFGYCLSLSTFNKHLPFHIWLPFYLSLRVVFVPKTNFSSAIRNREKEKFLIIFKLLLTFSSPRASCMCSQKRAKRMNLEFFESLLGCEGGWESDETAVNLSRHFDEYSRRKFLVQKINVSILHWWCMTNVYPFAW